MEKKGKGKENQASSSSDFNAHQEEKGGEEKESP